MIYLGSSEITGINVGRTPVQRVYSGGHLVWEAESWDFVDDFERSSIGSAWSGSGGVIDNGTLKKNTSEGTAHYWTAEQFSSDDIDVEVTIGTTQDSVQEGVVKFGGGPGSHFAAIQFSKNRFNAFGFNGGWPNYADFPTQSLADGDRIRVSRRGDNFTVKYNGNQIGSFTSSLGKGTSARRIGVEVKMAMNFLIRWYGPTFDAVRIRAN